MEFHVHVDLVDAIGPAVHAARCHCVRRRRRDAVTTRWYGPFSQTQARRVARREAGRQPVRWTPHCCGGITATDAGSP